LRGHAVHFCLRRRRARRSDHDRRKNAVRHRSSSLPRCAPARQQYLDGFHIGFDHWHTTDSPENVALSQSIYRALRERGLVSTRTIEPSSMTR